MMSNTVHLLLIKIEHGFLLDLMPIALQRFADKIMLGLESAIFDNVSKLSGLTNSEEISNTDIPIPLSEITIVPPRLSSDIALSIFTVNFILFIISIKTLVLEWLKKFHYYYMKKKKS